MSQHLFLATPRFVGFVDTDTMFHAGPVIPSMIFAAGPGGQPKPIIIGYAPPLGFNILLS